MNEDVKTILKYPCLPIPDRGIGQGCAELYGIRTQVDSNTLTPLAHYFPYYDKRGNLTGFKKRDLTKKKKESFSAIGDLGHDSKPFGWQTLTEDTRRLVICEGEFDSACLHSILRKANSKSEKYKDIIPQVVSIATGTAGAVNHLLHNRETLLKYKEIVLVFDSDEATEEEKTVNIVKGLDAAAEVCLTFHDLNIKYVKLGLKDPCDYYTEGKWEDLAKLVTFGAKDYFPESLVEFDGTDEEIDRLMKPLTKGVYLKCLPKTSAMLHGIRKGELTTFLSQVKSGKSTLAKQVAFELAKDHGWKVANFYLEEDYNKAQQSYISLYNNVRVSAFRENPSILSREQVVEARDFFKSNMLFYDAEQGGALSPESVLRMAKHCAIMGYDALIFDHCSFVATKMKEERRGLDDLLTELSMIVRAYPIHIWMIAHISRSDFKPPIDPETKEIAYPYYHPIRSTDARGSSIFEAVSFNLLALENEVVAQDQKGKARIKVLCNREWGTTGIGDTLVFNNENGRLE